MLYQTINVNKITGASFVWYDMYVADNIVNSNYYNKLIIFLSISHAILLKYLVKSFNYMYEV